MEQIVQYKRKQVVYELFIRGNVVTLQYSIVAV